MIGRRAANDGCLDDQPTANLPHDPIERDAGKRADVLEHVPGSGMGAHLLEHFVAEILPALVAFDGVSANELAARNTRPGQAVPHLLTLRAERTDSAAGGDLERMAAGRKVGATFGSAGVRRKVA